MIIFQKCHHTKKFTSHKSILVTNSIKSEAILKISIKFHFCSHAATAFIITKTIERCHINNTEKAEKAWPRIAYDCMSRCLYMYDSVPEFSERFHKVGVATGFILFYWTNCSIAHRKCQEFLLQKFLVILNVLVLLWPQEFFAKGISKEFHIQI